MIFTRLNNKLLSMPKRTTSIPSSTSQPKDGNLSAPPPPPDSPSVKLFSTLDLPLDKFIRCLCDGALAALIIEGSPSDLELRAAWEAIFERFLDAMKDSDGLYMMRLNAKINTLEFNYKFIHLCLERLRVGYSRFAADCLRKLIRVDGELNPEDQDRYFRALQTVQNRAQRLQVEIGDKKAEKALLEKTTTGSTVQLTREHFDNLIGQVSRYMKFYIDRRIVSIGEFVSFYMQMREEGEAIKKQNAKKRR
jgi:hypothetical protein